MFHQADNRIGDLVLATGRGFEVVDYAQNLVVEAVHTRDRQIRRWFFGLLDQTHNLTSFIQNRYAELSRVRDFHQTNHGIAFTGIKRLNVGPNALLEQVVTQVHAKIIARQETFGLFNGVCQSKLLFLQHKLEFDPRQVLDRLFDVIARQGRNDQTDLGDARIAQVLDGVNDHRFVGDLQDRFGPRVRQRTKPSTKTGGKDQALHGRPRDGVVRHIKTLFTRKR